MTTQTLPHWDVTVVYPSLSSPALEAGFRAVLQMIDELVTLFDEHHINAQASAVIDDAITQTFETIAARYNETLDQQFQMFAYLSSFVSTDSRNELAQAKQSELRQQAVRLNVLGTRFTAWLGSLDVEALIARSACARDHAHMLRRAKIQATHLLSPAEETLAAELSVTGSGSWAKLYNTFTSQLLVPIELDGKPQELPMSAIRNLAYDANRETRRRAYEAELAA